MKRSKKGFTLIELLAVIVILAIIALIAVPVILNIIDKANKSSFKDTAYGVLSAGELYFAEQQFEPNGMTEDEVTFELPSQVNTENGVQIKGEVPNGVLKVNKEGKVALALYNGRYCAKKEYIDNDIVIIENLDECSLGVPTISELERLYTFNYYSSLLQAVNDVNNNEVGVNSNEGKEGAIAGVYTTNGQSYVVLLQDTTEQTGLQISTDMTLNLGGHKLTTTDANAINLTAGNLVIDGRLEGSAIEKTNTNADAAVLVKTAAETAITVSGGTYSISNENRADAFQLAGEASLSDAVINVNSISNEAIGVYSVGNINVSGCDITAISGNGKVRALYVVRNNVTVSNSKIKAASHGLGSNVYGILTLDNVDLTVTNCNITADGHSDYIPEGETVAKTISVYAISSGSTTKLTIDGGYYWGAREALGIHGMARINGGVYEGCQHGGAYMSGNDIKVKNATFRNVDYTGEVGWDSSNWHGAAVYCGGSNGGANVWFDNCRFESTVKTTHGIVAKYRDTKVYLSNSVIEADTNNIFRADATDYIYLGENVSGDINSFMGDGYLDATTYAGQNFGEW